MHEAPAASEVPQLLVWVKSPVVAMEPIVSEASPELVSVAACVVVVCTICGVKVRLGVNPATGATPVPDRAAEAVNGCELVNESVAVLLPRESGLKATEIVQLAAGASDAGQLFVWLKSVLPERVIAVTFSGASPLFVRVRLCSAVVATRWLPKLNAAGVKAGTGAMPVPLRVTFAAAGCELLCKLSVPLATPRAFGLKVMVMPQLAPAGSDVPQVLV